MYLCLDQGGEDVGDGVACEGQGGSQVLHRPRHLWVHLMLPQHPEKHTKITITVDARKTVVEGTVVDKKDGGDKRR